MNMKKFHLLFYLALLPVVSSAQDRIGLIQFLDR